MDLIREGWFSEINDLWPGHCKSLKVQAVLSHERSKYQDVLVLQTTNNGRALILDGIIQCTEHDEFSYQEMISLLPLCAHENPEKVLIVGGGDGGVAREVAKHPLVKEIIQVEIDQTVIDVSKKYLPSMAVGFDSPKLTLKVCDGFEFMRTHQGEFDVIVTDSSDPIGPATNLFTEAYFALMKTALKANGIICSQAGNLWTDLDHIKQTLGHCRKHFKTANFAITSVPTYPSGQIGFVVASLQKMNMSKPSYIFSDDEIEEHNLRYYNHEVHAAAFVLPNFARKELS